MVLSQFGNGFNIWLNVSRGQAIAPLLGVGLEVIRHILLHLPVPEGNEPDPFTLIEQAANGYVFSPNPPKILRSNPPTVIGMLKAGFSPSKILSFHYDLYFFMLYKNANLRPSSYLNILTQKYKQTGYDWLRRREALIRLLEEA